MAKGKGKNRPNRTQTKSKSKSDFYQKATGNVELQDAPQSNLLAQQLQQATADFQRERTAGRSIYGGGAQEIRDLPRPDFAQTGADYTNMLGSVAPMFGGDQYMPGSEQGAGNTLGQGYGEAGATMLANLSAREGMSRSSAARENQLSGRYAQDALLQNFQDTLQGYNNQLGQVKADDPWQISQEVSRLKEQSLTQQLAKQKMESEDAFSKWLQDYYGSSMGGGNQPGGNQPGGNRPGGGQPNIPANPQTGAPPGGWTDMTASQHTSRWQRNHPGTWASRHPGRGFPTDTGTPQVTAPGAVPSPIAQPDLSGDPGVQGPSRYPIDQGGEDQGLMPDWMRTLFYGGQ
jgi:hypothetical protein